MPCLDEEQSLHRSNLYSYISRIPLTEQISATGAGVADFTSRLLGLSLLQLCERRTNLLRDFRGATVFCPSV